ncbi:MAG: hypothetical protein JNG84_13000 [Archangium sp.]|nr:hypothetical protein [Archangium sp.]
MTRWLMVATLALVACSDKKLTAAPDAGRSTPLVPMEPLARAAPEGDAGEVYFAIIPLPPVGPVAPAESTRIVLDGEMAPWTGGAKPVVLVAREDTYLAQVAALLASLDDAGATVWLAHPDVAVAYPVTLRDEPAFNRWLDEPVPGKLRVVHRQDGFELQTNMGKMPGPDINGPTVPVRGGKWDLTTLQRGFGRIKTRFPDAPDVCFMPSFGMPMADVARAVSANWLSADETKFSSVCLVYPRPVVKAADAGSAAK